MSEPSIKRQIDRWNNIKRQDINILKCYICDYENTINEYKIYKSYDKFNAGELIRYQCPNCDVIFGDLRFLNLSKDEIDKDYQDVYSYIKEGDSAPYIINVFNTIDILKDKKLKYLDYACGEWNNSIEILSQRGYNIKGYDKYINGKNILNNLYENSKFDVIYNNNYAEHLINPLEDISYMLSFLEPNGYLVFITPCFDYCVEYTHYHTFYFSDKSLQIIADKLNISFIKSYKLYLPNDNENYTIVKIFQKK